MREDNLIRLRHMLDAAREAVSFSQGVTRIELASDRKLVLALVKEIEIIGEAAYQIPQTARDEAPGIPWDDIVGMRHRLVHAYFEINLDILWQTVNQDLPPLISALEELIQVSLE
ncbi:MAG: DUF86 domain-containing protein [Desulfobacterales bacterium]